ncbi:MAG: OmpA family protein, partial [Myxococcota bacterium]|nr:OmpA family protein [Myxococcota bacterium]
MRSECKLLTMWTVLAAVVAVFATSGCASGSRLRVQQMQVSKQVEDMRSRAYRCAPRELALAESHAQFGAWELDQGNFSRAGDHLKYAAEFSELADQQSRAPECQDVQVVVSSDRDGDGIPDDIDQCPDEPEDFDGDKDEDGCPDIELDKDGDRIPDKLDRCPLDPEDYDAFEDEDGCPDPDNDKDTICDPWVSEQGKLDLYECKGSDQCPDVPEDFDEFEDEDGCPELDNDNDKIPDTSDKCPNDPEDYDGDEDEDGCPETRTLVTITEDRIELNQQFFF